MVESRAPREIDAYLDDMNDYRFRVARTIASTWIASLAESFSTGESYGKV